MALRNNFVVYINGINLTPFCVNPLKWGNFLDEQLDEMYLSLRHGPFENIKPLSPVEIHFTNELYFGKTTVDTQTKIKRYLVANDNSEESPVGSMRYNHDLYLIEITKFAECVVVDTVTFTNDLGRSYTKNATQVVPVESGDNNNLEVVYPQGFKNPMPVGENFTFPAPHNVYTIEPVGGAYVNTDTCTYKLTIFQNNNSIFTETYTLSMGGASSGQNNNYSTILENNSTYEALYECSHTFSATGPGGTSGYTYTGSISYSFVVVENYYPLKPWTITDVINRLLDIAEPIRQGERPRFILQGINPDTGDIQPNTQAALFDKILAPQFSFTKQTLRECLKEIGGVVHGEPRLDIAQDSDGNYYYEVSFDLYGQTNRAGIYAKPYIQKTVSQVIDSYASAIDSNAENLVNQLDKLAGVIVEPYSGGYKTVRTETMYARITDANMLIQTQYPIYTVEKLECGFIPDNSSISAPIDITPYLFESSIYNTRLSSYEELYPYSKAYGLMFTQGQKNITALNFKDPDAVSTSFFSQYAIINILREATGNRSLSVTDYPLLAFRVTYTPFYNSRVGQTKVNYQDYPYAAALIYNQQSNVIESRYYGENLKGVIARLGNVDKSITYNLARLSDIPQAGQMYDANYYISTVAVEYLPTYIKCTIGLSKDFNRLSQYIGISSVKRYSEVSQGQALERNTLWKEYIVVGDSTDTDDDCYVGYNFMLAVANTFTQSGEEQPLTNVAAWGESYSGSQLNAVYLPVISSAFGNSIAFSWTYEDNYSAGAISQYATQGTGTEQVSGYFQNNYQYTDYYGRMYFYNFDLQEAGVQITSLTVQNEIAVSLPEGEPETISSRYISTVGQSPITLRKDNREALQCNFQVDFISNRDDLIIGSALASYCPLIRTADSSLAAKLYIFDEPLDKFIYHVEGSLNLELSNLTAYDITVSGVSSGQFSVTAANFPVSGKAWAIVTAQSLGDPYMVENEQGEQFSMQDVKGGDVLIAQNMDFSAGDAFPTVYFTKKREVFNKNVWIANR